MNIGKPKEEKGFTIIEVVVYLGLLSIILTGSISTAFYLFYTADTIEKKIAVNAERNFVFNIVKASLHHEINRFYMPNGSYEPYLLSLQDSTMYLQIGSGQKIPLNLSTHASNFAATALVPTGWKISVRINGQDLAIRKYVR